jgi:hypothetical protein
MYLGIDFLVGPGLNPYVIEVNVGLPGGAQEYHRTHLVFLQKPSEIFSRIEEISGRLYGRPFRDYLNSLPFIESLKLFKIWMDGRGPFPPVFHPGLRLEDKGVQYRVLSPLVPMPETLVFDPGKMDDTEMFLKRKGRLVLKPRLARGGRHFRIIDKPSALQAARLESRRFLLQEYIDSRVDDFIFSIRSVAFGGEAVCMYANLSRRAYSNHGLLAYVMAGEGFGLVQRNFKTEFFNQRSWEAEIWFGGAEPAYLHHNLYEDEVAQTALILPGRLLETIRALSVRIERFYDKLDLTSLPRACFEEESTKNG